MTRGTSEDDSSVDDGGDHLLTRRQALARLGLAGLLAAGAGPVLNSYESPAAAATSGKRHRHPSRPPNVLLIMADDMRYDQLPYMPNVRRLIGDQGRAFTQARCNVPLCQPSRVGLMTGQMSKHNGEIGTGFRGTTLMDNDNCIGKWMHDAGYRCGFFGKYVNFWDNYGGGMNAPAGYSTWRELTFEKGAYEFGVHLNRGIETIKGQYSSDYVAAEATRFLGGDGPFLCMVTPTQPHAPYRPRKDLAHKWRNLKWHVVDELDVSDKPSWIQALPPLTPRNKVLLREEFIGSLEELSAVDDMVRKILTAMDPAVLEETIVIFTSDNGVHHGEHRRRGTGTKAGPYEVGLHVPLLVRGPGFAPGPAITVPVLLTQDIAATMVDVGGATAGLPNQDGISLVELCAHASAHSERTLLHEIGEGYYMQTGDGITTGPKSSRGFRKLYRYPSVRANPLGPFTYEAYDLDTDPNEFTNWANDPARADERRALEIQLEALLA